MRWVAKKKVENDIVTVFALHYSYKWSKEQSCSMSSRDVARGSKPLRKKSNGLPSGSGSNQQALVSLQDSLNLYYGWRYKEEATSTGLVNAIRRYSTGKQQFSVPGKADEGGSASSVSWTFVRKKTRAATGWD